MLNIFICGCFVFFGDVMDCVDKNNLREKYFNLFYRLGIYFSEEVKVGGF